MRKRFILICSILLILPGQLRLHANEGERKKNGEMTAQNRRYSKTLAPQLIKREWSFWSGISFDSPAGSFIGVTEGREFFIVGLQYGRTLAASRQVSLEYTFDFIPVAIVTENPKIESLPETKPVGNRDYIIIKNESVYGLGFAPIGLKFNFLQSRRARFFLNASGGMLLFTENVPHPHARKRNFTFDLGGGVQIFASSHWALTFGYKLHHLSNANTADANPGLDASIFYLGISSLR